VWRHKQTACHRIPTAVFSKASRVESKCLNNECQAIQRARLRNVFSRPTADTVAGRIDHPTPSQTAAEHFLPTTKKKISRTKKEEEENEERRR
jgi:hypothetical protein